MISSILPIQASACTVVKSEVLEQYLSALGRVATRCVLRNLFPWNKGILVGQKRPLQPKNVWSIRVRLEMSGAIRELALFNLAIDSKLRARDLVKLRVEDLWSGSSIRDRATIIQKKTKRPVQFEVTEQTKTALVAWLPFIRRNGGSYQSSCKSALPWFASWSGCRRR